MSNRIAAATLSGLIIVFSSGCSPWVNDALHLVQDVKKTSDEYGQEKHEKRVEELDQEYEEFMKSQGKPQTNDDDPEQSSIIMKDDIDAESLAR